MHFVSLLQLLNGAFAKGIQPFLTCHLIFQMRIIFLKEFIVYIEQIRYKETITVY